MRSARSVVRDVRAEIGRAALQGMGWRAVIDALRPHWEVYRHRLAPAVAEILIERENEGLLKFYAGRLQLLDETGDRVHAQFRRRGTKEIVRVKVTKVINCTGPRTDYSKYQHPLLVNLLARGLIDHDPLALGLNALPTGEVLRYHSGPTGWLYTLGAPLKGVLWE